MMGWVKAYVGFLFRCYSDPYQSWTWVAILVLLGFALGGATGYYLFVRDMNGVSDRLNAIQQQIAPPAPAPDAKPADGKAAKEHRRR
jgi:hypothetical protein